MWEDMVSLISRMFCLGCLLPRPVWIVLVTPLFCNGQRSVTGGEINGVYNDGSVRNFDLNSISNSVTYRRSTPAAPPDIPPYCRSSLVESCLQPEANSITFYALVINSVTVIKLTSGPSAIQKEAISLPCIPNDFVTLPNSLLVSCRDATNSETQDYCVDNMCNDIPLSLGSMLDGRVIPIAYRGIHDGSVEGLIIAVTTDRKLVTFIVNMLIRRSYNLPNTCTEPVSLSRQGSTVLLTCTNDTQVLVNITGDGQRNVFFHQIDSDHGPLLALSNYGFALFLSPGGSLVTLQNIVPGNAITIPIDNTNHSVFADFTSDGRFAFVTVNSTAVLFIYVTEAIGTNTLNSQYFHTVTTTQPLCSTCPAVQFLSTTLAIISSYNMQSETTTVSVMLLTQWPPCILTERTLGGQPRHYWLNHSTPLPESCGVVPSVPSPVTITSSSSSSTILLSPIPTSSTSSNSNSSDLSTGAIAGIAIAIGIVLTPIVIVLVILVIVYVVHARRPGNVVGGQEPIAPQGGRVEYNNRLGNVEIRNIPNVQRQPQEEARPDTTTPESLVTGHQALTKEPNPHYPVCVSSVDDLSTNNSS